MRVFFFFLLLLLKQKEIIAVEREWRFIQSTTQDYQNKMIYDSEMGRKKKKKKASLQFI